MQIKTFGFVVFLLLISGPGFGMKPKADTAVINRWIKSSDKVKYTQPEVAYLYIDSILEMSTQENYQFGLYSAYNRRGIYYFMTGDYKKSISEYKKALEYTDENTPYQEVRLYSNIAYSLRILNLNDSALGYNKKVIDLADKYGLETIYQQTILDLASVYLNQEDYTESAKYYHLVELDTESSNDEEYLIKAYSSLAMFYYRVGNFDKSYNLFKLAIKIDEEYESIDFIGINHANLGLLYQDVAQDYDSAIYFFRKSTGLFSTYVRPRKYLMANINIGNAFIDRNVLDSAYYYYNLAYQDTLLEDFPVYKAAVYTNLGMYHLRNEELIKARKFLNDGLSLSMEYELLRFQRNAHRELSSLDSIQGKHEDALKHFHLFHQISESLKLMEANNQMAILEYEKFAAKEKYNNELLTKENENQNQEIIIQRAIIGLVFLMVLVLIVIVLIVSKNRRRVKSLNTNLKNSNRSLEELNYDLKLQKNEMKELLMSKDRFVSILGHDLKNPFTGLLGLLELIEMDWDDMPDEEKREGIRQLNQSSIQTYQLLEDLLDWGKTQQGLIKAEKLDFKLYNLFFEVKTIYSLPIKKKEIDVILDIDENCMVNSDRKLCSQILQNLLGNAIKYSHSGGKIILSAEQNSQNTSICIKDQGIGIPNDKIESLFKLDSNYNRPGTHNEKSTGMGLLLCKEYANIMDAELSVQSINEKGSTFCLVINNQD